MYALCTQESSIWHNKGKMGDSMMSYADFRQRLDTVLRTLDVKQVQNFLIAEGQWSPGQPVDPEFAMWMVAIQCCPVYTFSLTAHSAR